MLIEDSIEDMEVDEIVIVDEGAVVEITHDEFYRHRTKPPPHHHFHHHTVAYTPSHSRSLFHFLALLFATTQHDSSTGPSPSNPGNGLYPGVSSARQ